MNAFGLVLQVQSFPLLFLPWPSSLVVEPQAYVYISSQLQPDVPFRFEQNEYADESNTYAQGMGQDYRPDLMDKFIPTPMFNKSTRFEV